MLCWQIGSFMTLSGYKHYLHLKLLYYTCTSSKLMYVTALNGMPLMALTSCTCLFSPFHLATPSRLRGLALGDAQGVSLGRPALFKRSNSLGSCKVFSGSNFLWFGPQNPNRRIQKKKTSWSPVFLTIFLRRGGRKQILSKTHFFFEIHNFVIVWQVGTPWIVLVVWQNAGLKV